MMKRRKGRFWNKVLTFEVVQQVMEK